MNAVIRALFDDAAITGAQVAGLKDTSTSAMQEAVREWFELFFMRESSAQQGVKTRRSASPTP